MAVAVACSVFGSSRAAPAKPSSCQNDNECAEGQYCRIVYSTSSCTPCLDCGSYNRKPGIGQCVKARSECGECLPGFEHIGIQCSRNAKDTTTSKYTNSVLYIPPNKPTSADAGLQINIFEVKNVGSVNHTGDSHNEHPLVPPGKYIWIYIAASAVTSVVGVTGLVMKYCRRPVVERAGPAKKDEETELELMSGSSSTHNSGGGGDQRDTADPTPTAPPEESVKNPLAYRPGSYENTGGDACEGQKLMGSDLAVTQAGVNERIARASHQQANPFSAGNAAGPEALAFLAQNPDEDVLSDEDPDEMRDLIENELFPPAPVQPPLQQVPQMDLENPVVNLPEVSIDLGAVPLGDDAMEIDEGIPVENNELLVHFRLEFFAAIPANGQGNVRNGQNEPRNDSGVVTDEEDGVVPSSPLLSRTVTAEYENNPSENNNNNGQNVDQFPEMG